MALPEFISIRQTGKIAISLENDERLCQTLCKDEIIIAGDNGKAIDLMKMMSDQWVEMLQASFDTDGGQVSVLPPVLRENIFYLSKMDMAKKH